MWPAGAVVASLVALYCIHAPCDITKGWCPKRRCSAQLNWGGGLSSAVCALTGRIYLLMLEIVEDFAIWDFDDSPRSPS